ncbi:MAG: protein translocase subunit SecD [Verrucomicrobiae bacterium]|nr:protein translocase subunit SecD [Verrucomicrobiae bacterium]
MSKKNLWKWLLTVFLVAWAISEIYPPTPRDLIQTFEKLAVNKDTNFTAIVSSARELAKQYPDRSYGNLLVAIGTNDITRYFPEVDVKSEKEPTRGVLNFLQRKAAGEIKLGLDLQGGTSFLVGIDTNKLNKADPEAKKAALSQAVEVIRKRVDRFGVAEPIIQPAGDDRILIQLPGLSEADKESAKRQIQRAAFLEFRMVHPQSDELIKKGIIPPGYEILKERRRDGNKEYYEPIVVSKKAERGFTGKYIKRAMPDRDPITGQILIRFELIDEGAKLFADITRENIGQRLAIVLDGELYSAPIIRSEIPSGSGVIEGRFTPEEAIELANVLENPLETPVSILEARDVEPSLGKDSIRSGITASIIGVVAVSIFMMVYYMLAGFVANLALILNIIILFGVLCYIDTTLTLPGIAGIVLTIGMAVDANVLIYERIREELAAGKSLKGAIAAGYSRAFGTIFDTNLTTLIASVILIYMGTGPVKGFGVTLTIGVSVSMFTALVVTRLIFDWCLDRNLITSLKMLHFFGTTNIDFIKYAKPAFVFSWIIIIIGMAYGVFVRGHNVLGPDFAGGDRLTLSFAQKVDVGQIRSTVEKLKIGEVSIQYQKDISVNKENLSIVSAYGTGERVVKVLNEQFPNAKFHIESYETVGPSVGREIQGTAIKAALIAMFGILIYVAFRYEFSFAVGAIVALVHDILMSLGIFFLAGKELNAPILAAVLTIIGFSVNDTIVIFDRIREDLKIGMKGTFGEIINRAINQTLSRTVITSGTVFLATLSLYIFGGGVINDFAFIFLVGIITGTYSSIYIASALVYFWHKGERPKLAAQPSIEEPAANQYADAAKNV